MDLQIEVSAEYGGTGVGSAEPVSELLEHKMRERVSDGIMVAWDVGGAEDIG